MKIVFISNYLTHHLSYFCEELISLGNDVLFLACESTPTYRIVGGFEDMSKLAYVVNLKNADSNTYLYYKNLTTKADAVIIGSGDNNLITERIKENGITFRFSEHLSKSRNQVINKLRLFKWKMKLKRENQCSNFFLLCSSSKASKDYAEVSLYQNRHLKWGYFPTTNNSVQKQCKSLNFVWSGRLIRWKHPEYLIYAYDLIKTKYDSVSADFTLIGSGNKKRIIKRVGKRNISILPAVPRDQLSSFLNENTIYIFSSDQGEGWGAILNEALSQGCICLANEKAGSTNYLIKNNYNGFVFKNKKQFEALINTIFSLSQDQLAEISSNAKNTIKTIWNARVAAKNLIKQIQSIKSSGRLIDGLVGPGSKE